MSSNKSFIKRKIKGIIITFVIVFVLPFFSFLLFNNIYNHNPTFEKGVHLCGVDVSGLTTSQALNKINDSINNTTIQLVLKYNEKKWIFTSKDFKVESKIHIILEELEKTTHKNAFINKAKILRQIKKMGFNDETAVNYVLLGINEKIDNIANEIKLSPISATATYNIKLKKFVIQKEKYGICLDKEKLYFDISNSLQQNKSSEIEVQTKLITPTFTYQDIEKSIQKQGEFSTKYTYSNSHRKNNIRLAVNALNGVIIMPGEIFSFNKTIGQRTLDKGYEEANIIKDGTFVKGVGGGICQVSSTLYNALLLSNIDIIEVHKHTLPVSYVPPCLDSMVSWGSADLKFKNTTNLPMYIIAKADGDKILFQIFGDSNPQNYTLKTRGEIINSIPPPPDKIIPDKDGKFSNKIMFKGEYVRVKNSKNGYEAKSFIDYYKGDSLIKTKELRTATYEPQQGIVYEGCEELPIYMTLPQNSIIPFKKRTFL